MSNRVRMETLADGVVMYHANCFDVFDKIPPGKYCCITDPPYGVNKAAWDTALAQDFAPLVHHMRTIAGTVMLTPGIKNLFDWPRPDWIASYSHTIGKKRAAGRGLSAWEPILIYGKNTLPKDHKHFSAAVGDDNAWHPTSKPLPPFLWLVGTGTKVDDTVVDPFCGSGTIGVAAIRIGRKFIGIEKDKEYFEKACARLRKELRMPSLLVHKPTVKRGSLL